MIVALQLYSLREACEQDFLGTLERVAKIGYKWIEPHSFYGVEPAKLSERLGELGLRLASSHVSIERLETELDAVMDEHETLGCKNIVCPWLEPERYMDGGSFEKVGKILSRAGGSMAKRGFSLAYHNHDFEFTEVEDPDGIFRIMISSKPKHLGLQLDVYWLRSAEVDPVLYIHRFGPRIQSIHLKDGDPRAKTFSPVGSGEVDIPGIIDAARALGIERFVVEQDECDGDPFEAAAASYEYLKSIELIVEDLPGPQSLEDRISGIEI